jgi:hypothetical protein
VAPNLREYALVDPLAWVFVGAIWLMTVQRRWWLAAALGGIGVLAKEVVVIAALSAAAASVEVRGRWSRSDLLRPLAVAAPAIVTAGTLTVVIPGSGTDGVVYLSRWIADGLGSLGLVRVIYLMFASYAALWVLVPRGFAALPDHLRRAALVYMAAALVLPLVGSPERMEELVFPAVIGSASLATRGLPLLAATLLGLANAAFVARTGGSASIPSPVSWMGLVLAVALALWAYLPTVQRPTRATLAAFFLARVTRAPPELPNR